jgi:creatinine amidohydrolase/Fe(II)-dependent formamide hydrolase-like protein
MYAGTMTADQVAEKNYLTAYFAIAPFMGHGPHLPLTASIMIAKAFAEAICSRIGAFMLPVQPFGTFLEHDEKYNINVDSGMLYEMVLDITRNLQKQGFRKLVIHQGFRGLSILYHLTRHINASENIKTVLVNPCVLAEERGGILQGVGNFHACELQTSLMMYLHRDCVREDKINNIDFVPDVPPQYLNYKSLSAYCPGGVWGHPSLANAAKGEKLFITGVGRSVAYINEAFAFMIKNGDYAGGLEQ